MHEAVPRDQGDGVEASAGDRGTDRRAVNVLLATIIDRGAAGHAARLHVLVTAAADRRAGGSAVDQIIAAVVPPPLETTSIRRRTVEYLRVRKKLIGGHLEEARRTAPKSPYFGPVTASFPSLTGGTIRAVTRLVTPVTPNRTD